MRRVQRILAAGAAVVAVTTLGAPDAANSAAPGDEVRFASSVFTASEREKSVTIRVERTGPLLVGRTTVDYTTAAGSAVVGTDFAETAGSLVFEVGERSKAFVVPIADDAVPESVEDFAVLLRGTGDSTQVGTPATIYLADDDSAARLAAPASVEPPARTSPAPPRVSNNARQTPQATARPRRPVGSARAAPRRHHLVYREGAPTPFEVRSPGSGTMPVAATPTKVDPLLALVAGLLLARVAASVWFRLRVDPRS